MFPFYESNGMYQRKPTDQYVMFGVVAGLLVGGLVGAAIAGVAGFIIGDIVGGSLGAGLVVVIRRATNSKKPD